MKLRTVGGQPTSWIARLLFWPGQSPQAVPLHKGLGKEKQIASL